MSRRAESSPDSGILSNPVQDARPSLVLTSERRCARHGGTTVGPPTAPTEASRVEPLLTPGEITIASSVAFGVDRSEIRPDFMAKLAAIAARLRRVPDLDPIIEGIAMRWALKPPTRSCRRCRPPPRGP